MSGLKFLCRKTLGLSGGKIDIHRILCSNKKFTKNLYKIIIDENWNNLLVSPWSMHCALSMLYAGAAEISAKSFKYALDLSDADTTAKEYHKYLSKVMTITPPSFILENKIFIKCGVKEDYLFILENKYFASAQSLDFEDSELSAKVINNWVKNQTNKRIKEVVKPNMLNDKTRLILVNIMYFKGDWLYKFPKVQKQEFYFQDGSSRPIDMMFVEQNFNYTRDERLRAQIVELPYKDEQISMFLFVPDEKRGITHLQNHLFSSDLGKIFENMTKRQTKVWLPKFTIESDILMKQYVEKMGLSIIFSNKAQFPKISHNSDLKVNDIIHKVFIQVSEEGNDFYTTTKKVSSQKHLSPHPVLKADHPFMFTLNLKSSSNIPFFFGRVMEL